MNSWELILQIDLLGNRLSGVESSLGTIVNHSPGETDILEAFKAVAGRLDEAQQALLTFRNILALHAAREDLKR